MSVRRKRYRIEEVISPNTIPAETEIVVDMTPVQREIMNELRAIRQEMGSSQRSMQVTSNGPSSSSTDEQIAQATALLATYRAQIEQCEKLKIELDLIHESISLTKSEIASLHGKGLEGGEMAKANGELGAIVGGTEEATQQILAAAEAIDSAATAIKKSSSPDQQARLVEEIQESVVSIFEACNFQDLTGQRINKVMNTMKFVENHISKMMDIWGGLDEIKAHAPVMPEREGDAALLNGPKLDGDDGHVSQDDIDALFG